jgi:hypothetical protein
MFDVPSLVPSASGYLRYTAATSSYKWLTMVENTYERIIHMTLPTHNVSFLCVLQSSRMDNYLPLSFSRSYHPSLSIKHILQATKFTVMLSIKHYKNEEGIEKIDIDQVG